MSQKTVFLLMALFTLSCSRNDKNISILNFPPQQQIGFEMKSLAEPVFPGNTVSIVDFGAVSNGVTLNTKAFSDAIDALAKKGGGRLIIPRGLWLTGPIVLKSNIDLHAEEGSLVIFSPDKSLYPLVETVFEGNNTARCLSPIYGKDLQNIAITGNGIFDGTGEAWRPVKKEKMTDSQWRTLIGSGGVTSQDGKIWYPSQSYLDGQNMSSMNVPDSIKNLTDFQRIKDFLRPVMVSLVNCKGVLLDGPTFQNSPAWCIHPLMCENLIIRNITVKNPWFSQNGDGLDIESCRNAVVYESNFDVGDDAICIKSGKDEDGRKRARPSENIIIKNCIVYHGHGGVTVGSEMSGGVRNMYVSGCTFLGTDVGLRFKTNRGRGGLVENLLFDGINMINIPTQAISFNMYYGGLSPTEMIARCTGNQADNGTIAPVTVETPLFRNITIRNLNCHGASEAILLQGLPEMNLEKIILENIFMEADNGLICMDASGVKINDLTLLTKNPECIQIFNSHDISINNLVTSNGDSTTVAVSGKLTHDISIRMKNPETPVKLISGLKTDRKSVSVR